MPILVFPVVIVLHLIIVLSISWSLNDDEVPSPYHLVISALRMIESSSHDDVPE
jgi:hypothetical protein